MPRVFDVGFPLSTGHASRDSFAWGTKNFDFPQPRWGQLKVSSHVYSSLAGNVGGEMLRDRQSESSSVHFGDTQSITEESSCQRELASSSMKSAWVASLGTFGFARLLRGFQFPSSATTTDMFRSKTEYLSSTIYICFSSSHCLLEFIYFLEKNVYPMVQDCRCTTILSSSTERILLP